MTDKELKRLSRSELLEMLIAQMKENDALQRRLEQAEALARQYSSRMTAAQKQKLQKIFGEYGAELAAF